MPSMSQAATYSAVLHYLRAIQAAGSADSAAVLARMKATPVHDVYTDHGVIRADGRLVHDMYLVRVKTPAESKQPWDYEETLQTVPGDQAFRPVAEAGCPLQEKI
jgi:branched-chain amino acid transport system substrate-binding protein